MIGVAKVDVTPDYAIRLTGYGNRREESEGVEQRLWAKALAIGSDAEEPAVLITVDNCGIPDAMRAEVAAHLAAKAGIKPERFAICFSHTHCGPCLAGALTNIFSTDVPALHQANIERYTRELAAKLEQVGLAALADRKLGRLSWAIGSASFARNRRGPQGGPVDHSLPVMFVHSPDGALRAVFANYACHATTLSFNKVHGDWPGTAMVAIERDHPDAVALISIGCGADQNPHPRGTLEQAVQHGEEVAAEVSRLLKGERKTLGGKLSAKATHFVLPLEPLPSRAEWETLSASKTQPIAYAAQKNLARLDRGEKLPVELPYSVQIWNFESDLAMVFLPGEVTVDYELRLKVEFDAARLWVNAYSNDALCYIPSKRVLIEGGYEGGSAMVYYDRPAKFAPGIEDRIISAVHEVVPPDYLANFHADVPPKSPSDSMAAIKTHDNLVVELAAAEPFVKDPVAIDWDAQGRMWVVEQPDYPNGMDGNWKPGGRVKILTDTDGDGRIDTMTLMLEGIPFPTGITCWGKGALVCAAPDILYVEDSKGSGKADVVRKLYTGFYTDNYNARVNSLSLGLDNWIHGANGLLGGKVRSEKTGQVVDISGRDIRIRPETGELELVSGVTQQGRARDDWDNWFGCSNSAWLFHFPLQEAYSRRNPHVPALAPSVYLPKAGDQGELNPISQVLERFNTPSAQGHITSACGLGIYRDVLLGPDYAGNVFIGEVAHNMVRRYRLDPAGATFEALRPENGVEFLASADNWTRPVQIRTGPDGALYIVDMYRAVIEHTRWIPADRLAKIDPRAGDTMGRIYRVHTRGVPLRPVRDLTRLDSVALTAALDTPNGTTRDLVHQLLLSNKDAATREPLAKLAAGSSLPAVRVQALSILDGMQALALPQLLKALADADAHVRRHALKLSESRFAAMPELAPACLKLIHDPDFTVRYQLALSLGEWNDPRAAAALGEVALTALNDKFMRAAVISSSTRKPLELLDQVIKAEGSMEIAGQLIATVSAISIKHEEFTRLIDLLAPKSTPAIWQLAGMANLQDSLDRRKISLTSLPGAEKLRPLFEAAHQIALNDQASDADRETALRLFARGFNEDDLSLLAGLLQPATKVRLQKAALAVLSRNSGTQVAETLLSNWTIRTPSLRAAIITILLVREEWSLRLLKAIEDRVINPAEVSAASRQALVRNTNAEIRERAQMLLPPSGSAERAKVAGKYQEVASLSGNAARGAAVFKNVCSVCHSFLGAGIEVGPDLKAFYNKSISDFVTAILDPNAAVDPRYASYAVITRDGRTLTGIIASELAASIDVVQPGGVRETLLRADIRGIRATGISLMPEGLEQALAPQDMADVIAFLKSGG